MRINKRAARDKHSQMSSVAAVQTLTWETLTVSGLKCTNSEITQFSVCVCVCDSVPHSCSSCGDPAVIGARAPPAALECGSNNRLTLSLSFWRKTRSSLYISLLSLLSYRMWRPLRNEQSSAFFYRHRRVGFAACLTYKSYFFTILFFFIFFKINILRFYSIFSPKQFSAAWFSARH